MKKSTLGIIATAVILVGGGGGCLLYQSLQTPPAEQAPAPAPQPTPTPEPTPAANTVSVSEPDNGTTVHATVGATVDLVLHSTYWQIQPTDSVVLKPLSTEPVVTGTLSNPPGMGTGTVEMKYQVVAAGTATLSASRTTCGEAMRCVGAQGEFKVTIVADAEGAAAAPTPTPLPPPAPAPIVNASVTISDFSFQPSVVTIQAGATVTWTNQDPMAHTVTADDGSFDSGMLGVSGSASASYSHVFAEPGTYA